MVVGRAILFQRRDSHPPFFRQSVSQSLGALIDFFLWHSFVGLGWLAWWRPPHGQLRLEGASYEAFVTLLEFLYTGW